MILVDESVLVSAYRSDHSHYATSRPWLNAALKAGKEIIVPGVVLSGFMRQATNTKIFVDAPSADSLLTFIDTVMALDNVRRIAPGPRHWGLFSDLCRQVDARSNLIPVVWLAAFAIENDAEFVTLDKNFGQFKGLRYTNLLEA